MAKQDMTDDKPDEESVAASRLAWAVLSFVQMDMPPAVRLLPEHGGILGRVAVKFFPSGLTVAEADAADTLCKMRKPVALASLSAKGIVGTWYPGDLPTPERAQFDESLARGLALVDQFCIALHLGPESRVLLKVNGMVHVFPLRVLRRFVTEYRVFVGWSLQELHGDARASVKLKLVRADGVNDDAPPASRLLAPLPTRSNA